jgi:CRP-like cAMP-binding protein
VSYDSLLSSQALRSFLSLHEGDEAPRELFLILDKISPRLFKSGEIIIREGDEADSLYIIDQGHADVISESSGGVLIGQLQAGDFFGEVAILTGKTRTATIAAKTGMRVFELARKDLNQLTEAYPHIVGTLLQKLYDRLKISYLSLEERNEELQQMINMRMELASLFTSVVLLITFYTFILGFLNADVIGQHLTTQSYYLISRLIEISTLVVVFKIIADSSLSWRDFGLNTDGAKKSIIEALFISLLIMVALCLLKYVAIKAYPEIIADKQILSLQYFDWTYLTYLVVAPLQEFITRGVVQSTLQRLLVGPYSWVSSIMITSFLFGSLHLFSSIYLGLAALLTSWLWGWMYYRHKNLIGVSLSHFLIGNFTGFLGLWTIF